MKQTINQPEIATNSGRSLLVIMFLFGVIASIALAFATMEQNLQGQQAIAFTRGSLSLADTPLLQGQDAAYFNGVPYSPLPPGPALLLAPFVLLFGAKSSVGLLVVPLAVLSGWLLFHIGRRLKIPSSICLWFTIGFYFGTGFFTSTLFSRGAWFTEHVIAVFCLLLALYTTLCRYKLRGVIAGLALGIAFLCRQLTILWTPLFIALLYDPTLFESAADPATLSEPSPSADTKSPSWYQLLVFIFCIGMAIAAYGLFNFARFGNVFDTGYEYGQFGFFIPTRISSYGLFSLHYVPFNLIYLLFQGFHVQFGGIDMLQLQGMDQFGTGLLIASPVLIAALYAPLRRIPRLLIWGIILAIVFVQLTYHNNGFIQINTQRFSLDYLPFLLILAVLGASKLPFSLIKGLILWSVLLNLMALIFAGLGLLQAATR